MSGHQFPHILGQGAASIHAGDRYAYITSTGPLLMVGHDAPQSQILNEQLAGVTQHLQELQAFLIQQSRSSESTISDQSARKHTYNLNPDVAVMSRVAQRNDLPGTAVIYEEDTGPQAPETQYRSPSDGSRSFPRYQTNGATAKHNCYSIASKVTRVNGKRSKRTECVDSDDLEDSKGDRYPALMGPSLDERPYVYTDHGESRVALSEQENNDDPNECFSDLAHSRAQVQNMGALNRDMSQTQPRQVPQTYAGHLGTQLTASAMNPKDGTTSQAVHRRRRGRPLRNAETTNSEHEGEIMATTNASAKVVRIPQHDVCPSSPQSNSLTTQEETQTFSSTIATDSLTCLKRRIRRCILDVTVVSVTQNRKMFDTHQWTMAVSFHGRKPDGMSCWLVYRPAPGVGADIEMKDNADLGLRRAQTPWHHHKSSAIMRVGLTRGWTWSGDVQVEEPSDKDSVTKGKPTYGTFRDFDHVADIKFKWRDNQPMGSSIRIRLAMVEKEWRA